MGVLRRLSKLPFVFDPVIGSKLEDLVIPKPPFRPEIGETYSFLAIGTRKLFDIKTDETRRKTRRFLREELFKTTNSPESIEFKKRAFQITSQLFNSEKGKDTNVSFLSNVISIEECMYGNLHFGIDHHYGIALPFFRKFAKDVHKSSFLNKLKNGNSVCCLIDTGYEHTLAIEVDGETWTLNGSINCSEIASVADLFMLTISNEAENPKTLLIDSRIGGLSIDSISKNSFQLNFKGVQLTEENVLHLDQELLSQFTAVANLLQSTASQARSELAFDLIRSSIRNRKVLEDDVKKILADAKTEICVNRLYVDNCLSNHLERKISPILAAMCRLRTYEVEKNVLKRIPEYLLNPHYKSYVDNFINSDKLRAAITNRIEDDA
ncbi:DgyrCDS4178 [Dimorphilus gyrociliatus]|uniref:DgyrCDS4178 n=1 Tax=Dimorphilus gyrociliatus TaxID=2664684 RepID=A0A7I8VHM8_9ANNE|nr:DgyrCDS4178 [Dimorphilus gyrociliatus]